MRPSKGLDLQGHMQQARTKRHRRYLFYRAYCVTFGLAWNVGIIWIIMSTVQGDPPALFLVLVPLVIPAIFMLFNLMAFRFLFSIFGPLERSQAPRQPPLLQARARPGAIGLFFGWGPFFTWRLYQGGIGFTAFPIGRGYVPFDKIVEVRTSRRGCMIRHTSVEVRSPINIPRGRFCRQLDELWTQRCTLEKQCEV